MIFATVFLLLAAGFIGLISYALYLVHPPLVWTIPVYWLLMAVGNKYAMRVMIALDQGWQVVVSPILNLWKPRHKFGAPDETASSVCGKNLRDTGETRWKILEVIFSWLFEGGKPHSIKAIEDDEGIPNKSSK